MQAAEFNDPGLLEGIEIRHDEGAAKTAMQALLLQKLSERKVPMVVVLDWDEPGRQADKLLKERGQGIKSVFYRNWKQLNPSEVQIEAEDMFPQKLLEKFVEENGDLVISEKAKFEDQTFHYGFDQAGKDLFLEYLSRHHRPELYANFVTILRDLRKMLKIPSPAAPPAMPGTPASEPERKQD
jgi:hypothetical protein